MDETFHPLRVAPVDADGLISGLLHAGQGDVQIGDLEREVMWPRPAANQESVQEIVELDGVGHEDLELGPVAEPQLTRRETGRQPPRGPLGSQIASVLVPDVLPAGDSVSHVVEHDPLYRRCAHRHRLPGVQRRCRKRHFAVS